MNGLNELNEPDFYKWIRKQTANTWSQFGLASFIAGLFMAFTVGWLVFIPAAVAGFLIYGYVSYMKDRKNRITVAIKPTEAMKALAHMEEELKKEKEKILYEQFGAK